MQILLLNFVSLIPSFFQILMSLRHLVWILNNWLKFSTLPVVLLWIQFYAPLKRKKCKISSSPQPWFNASTRTLRQECRRAERRWKKDGLQVSYQILKNCLTVYQNSVREAKSKYFSNLIAKNANRPKVLFKTINSVLSPIVCSVPDVNIETCTKFSEFFCSENTIY